MVHIGDRSAAFAAARETTRFLLNGFESGDILTHGKVIERYDEDFPLPSVLLHGLTEANRPLHVVVGINVDEQKLVIITTYEPDALQWADNFSRRII